MSKKTSLIIIVSLIAIIVILAVFAFATAGKTELNVSLNGTNLKSEVSCLNIGGERYISADDLDAMFNTEININGDKLEITSFDKIEISGSTAGKIGDAYFSEVLEEEYIKNSVLQVDEIEYRNEVFYSVCRVEKSNLSEKNVAVMNDYYVLVDKQGNLVFTPEDGWKK